MCDAIKANLGSGCVTCFLNGALGDLHHQSTLIPDYIDTKERIGQLVAESVLNTLPTLKYGDSAALRSATSTIASPLRDIDGPYGINMAWRQRFAPDEISEQLIARVGEALRRAVAALAPARIAIGSGIEGRV
jgi:hypothetical protein